MSRGVVSVCHCLVLRCKGGFQVWVRSEFILKFKKAYLLFLDIILSKQKPDLPRIGPTQTADPELSRNASYADQSESPIYHIFTVVQLRIVVER